MSDLLKGNFTVRRPVAAEVTPPSAASAAEELALSLRKAAMCSIGGSMVYVERTALTWDGE